jgi:hypothetical protein
MQTENKEITVTWTKYLNRISIVPHWRTMRAFGICLLLAFASIGTLFAQADRGTITGLVTDPTGSVITNARVVVTQTSTGLVSTATTNNDGIYTIPGLPVGNYKLTISYTGFNDYAQTGIILIAAQVLQVNVHMSVGSSAQTVTVTGGAPLLDTETSTVAMTMEESAIQDLPLNAFGGQDAVNLMLTVTPGVTGTNGSNQDFVAIAGMQAMTNSVYLNGVESTTGLQGNFATPGKDALQEIQIQSNVADAEFGSPSTEMFQVKSGGNSFHGSAFEIMQNEDLNANTYANKQFGAQCAPGDTVCLSQNSRPLDRFNDYGFTGGAPIWKNRAFVFGSYEYYSNTDDTLVPNSQTVPTPQMLDGDFSQLLTEGSQTGNVLGPDGTPWINPCTGQPYQYGQIFDPRTQAVVGGVTCAAPFDGNIIPSNLLSSTAKNVAAIYSQYYKPTISTRIYNNFPTMLAGTAQAQGGSTPKQTKRSWDFKFDEALSDRQHVSFSFDRTTWDGLGLNGLFNYTKGPFSSYWQQVLPSTTYQLVHTYSITPNLLNTVAVEYGQQVNLQIPSVSTTNNGDIGFNSDSSVFPVLNFGTTPSNGILVNSVSTNVNAFYAYYADHLQDTLYWNKGRHSMKFGGTFMAREMNANFGGNVENYNFTSNTGGPTDPGLTPYVGSSFASAMLGDVQSASKAIPQYNYPRQKTFALFLQDSYKVKPKLTLNLGLRWDVNLRGHEQAGRWQNFDLTAQNPLWGSYPGAWDFVHDSGRSFETNEDYYHQFAPRVGGAYELTPKLLLRASYGLYFVPINTFNSGFGSGFPANQNSLSFPISEVLNNVPGATAFNWDGGYPGQPIVYPQDNTDTNMGSNNAPLYIHPDFLHLGYTQNWYIGTQYELSQHTALNVSYIANRGRQLQSAGLSSVQNFPSFSTYQPVLLAGNINKTISNASDAAAIGVPYPYAGFSGPAYAAIAPFPQVAAWGDQVTTYGNPQYGAVSAYNSLIVEIKARGARGLYADFSYDLSKQTGNYSGGNGNWGGGTASYGENLADYQDAKHWLQSTDQRHLFKGYMTYQLPFGKDRKWLSGYSWLMNEFIGGWELGYYGAYGSGFPMGAVNSTYQLPFFFGGDRAFLAPGQSAYSVANHFKGHLNLSNLNDAGNTDFNRNLFVATTPSNPFGNSPYTWNHWRWNSHPAQENVSITKHFGFAVKDHQFQAVLAAQFFDFFNRHYYNSPDINMADPTFGQVTGVSGNRNGQVSARFTF